MAIRSVGAKSDLENSDFIALRTRFQLNRYRVFVDDKDPVAVVDERLAEIHALSRLLSNATGGDALEAMPAEIMQTVLGTLARLAADASFFHQFTMYPEYRMAQLA